MDNLKVNDAKTQTTGTSLQGALDIHYQRLVEVLGEPQEGDGYKVDAEWSLKFPDGTVATLYNWKNGHNYLGDDGDDVEDIHEWHIGGTSQKAVQLVNELFGVGE